jgi:predicted MFS family arabinose efflux permease
MNTEELARGTERQAEEPSRTRRLLPLVLATMASQALLVVLAPTIVEVAREFGVSVGVIGQARSVLAGASILTSLAIAPFLDRLGIRPLLLWGAVLAIGGSTGAALSPSLPVFFSVHVVMGAGFACLLSAGFAGVGAFPREDRAWAMGYVVGANALAWIAVNPLAGELTDTLSWRTAHAGPIVIALCVLVSAQAAPRGSATGAPRAGRGLRYVIADRSARRWLAAESIAFFAWGANLTFTGAFFIERFGITESTTGILLAFGAAMFFVASVRGAPLVQRLRRPRLIAAAALITGAMIVFQFNTRDMLWIALMAWILGAVTGGIRSAVSPALGLAQLPDRPGSMMAARTATLQIGYLLGGLLGGAALAWSGYAALGFILGAGMILAAVLALRVTDPR